MRVHLAIVIALTALCAPAAERNPALVSARDHYANADFRRAAAGFQLLCNINKDAEACYWAGLSYERLADIAMPFGCRIEAKAREYYSQAVKLKPGLPVYRDALFNFLLNTADCSHTALRDAAAMLSAVQERDSDFEQMSRLLEQERHRNGSLDARLARVFLIVPRATYRIAVPQAR